MCEFLSCIYTSEFLLREKALKNKSSHPSRHTHAPWAFFPPTQVVTVVCSAACGCQEAHAISQFSSVSPLDHPTNPIHSLNQTRVRLLPPPLYLSNFVLEKHKLHLRVSRWSPTCNHPAGVPSICCFPSFISKFDFIPAVGMGKKKKKKLPSKFQNFKSVLHKLEQQLTFNAAAASAGKTFNTSVLLNVFMLVFVYFDAHFEEKQTASHQCFYALMK